MEFERPLPQPTPVTQPFWDALREHKVRIQHCASCASHFYYPRAACPRCWKTDLEWVDISGAGSVHTFTIARAPTAPHFAAEVPQIIALVELDEGPRVTTTLVDVEPEQVRVGMRVVPRFEDVPGSEITLLRFAPAG